MTEAEILQLSFSANEAIAGLFSIFFGIVSAYIAGIYFFLHNAPFTLRLIAFALLTIGFLFLGQAMAGVEVRVIALVEAWNNLSIKTLSDFKLDSPLPLPVRELLAWYGIEVVWNDGTRLAIYSGWVTSSLVYLALFYATFLYRWPSSSR